MIPSANQGVEDEPSKNITILTSQWHHSSRQGNFKGPHCICTIIRALPQQLGQKFGQHFATLSSSASCTFWRHQEGYQYVTKIEIHDENSKFDYSPIHTCDVWRFLLNATVNITSKDFVTQLHLLTSSIFNLSSLWS